MNTALHIALGLILVTAAAQADQATWPAPADLPPHPEMPDPLVAQDGQRITTPAQWTPRREEMKRIIEHYFTGSIPPPPGNVRGEDLDTRKLANETANFRRVKLSFGPESKLGFEIAILTPAGAVEPLPTI